MGFLRSTFSRGETLLQKDIFLRPPSLADYEAWQALRVVSKDFLTPWEPSWSEAELGRIAYRSRVRHYEYLISSDAGYPFFIFHKSEGHLLGAINISNVRRGVAQMCTLGYWIGKPYAGQGYMSQAVQASVAHAFGKLGLHRVEAACIPSNAASKAVLLRNGFQQEGFARNYLKIAGVWQDHLLFAKSPD